MSDWKDPEVELPPEGRYVLVRITRRTWIDGDDQDGVQYQIAKLVKGISEETRAKMKAGELEDPDYPLYGMRRGEVPAKRSAVHTGGDEGMNNERPYQWRTFGPCAFFGQEVDRWMEIPRLPSLPPLPPKPMPKWLAEALAVEDRAFFDILAKIIGEPVPPRPPTRDELIEKIATLKVELEGLSKRDRVYHHQQRYLELQAEIPRLEALLAQYEPGS